MYRYAAPQRGRYREHWQLSVEALGSDEPSLDAEVIQLYHELLRGIGVAEFRLELNSIGCRQCRPAYVEQLESWLSANLDRLDEPTRQKAAVNPLRVFDNLHAKPESVRAALLEAPAIGASLCQACREHFEAVRRHLDAAGVPYELDETLVRGLDYYTRTTWEFVGPEEGAQSSLSGGGRYDGLVEEIGGPATPGVGFGAGIERLVLALETSGVTPPGPHIDVFFALSEGAPREQVTTWLRDLRASGVACDTDYAGRSLKGQLGRASRLGATTIVVVRGDGAAIRRAGEQDEDVRLEDVPLRLSR
jgi:histidyl-tRNA synthetase